MAASNKTWLGHGGRDGLRVIRMVMRQSPPFRISLTVGCWNKDKEVFKESGCNPSGDSPEMVLESLNDKDTLWVYRV